MTAPFFVRLFSKIAALAVLILATVSCRPGLVSTQSAAVDRGDQWVARCKPNDAWDTPGPPYRVFGNTYYVGTCGIAAILIVGDQGHILIDGGTERGGELIAENIATLGFDIRDVGILLHSHEHYDHVGGLAGLQASSGAKMIASVAAAPVLRSGQVAVEDPQWGMHEPFPAVSVSATITHGEQVSLGDLSLQASETPGHSPGALSWAWTSCEQDRCKAMVYLDSLSPVSREGYRFADHPNYLANYRGGLASVRTIECDFVLTPHPVASGMHQRLSRPQGLEGKSGCRSYVDRIQQRLGKRLVSEEKSSP